MSTSAELGALPIELVQMIMSKLRERTDTINVAGQVDQDQIDAQFGMLSLAQSNRVCIQLALSLILAYMLLRPE